MKTILPFLFLLSLACGGQVIRCKNCVEIHGYLNPESSVQYTSGKSNVLVGQIAQQGIVDSSGKQNIGIRNANGKIIGDSLPNDFQIVKKTKPEPLSLEEKLLLYAQECWNDSTVEVYHNGYEPVYMRGWNLSERSCNADFSPCTKKSNPKHWDKRIIHRKPTFEGFIEWIQKHK